MHGPKMKGVRVPLTPEEELRNKKKADLESMSAQLAADSSVDLSQTTDIVNSIKLDIERVLSISQEPGLTEIAGIVVAEAVEKRNENEKVQIHKGPADALKIVAGKFARLLPTSTINPNVAESFWNGKILTAIKGTWHKLKRSFQLRSREVFSLKTKESVNDKTHADQIGKDMVSIVVTKQEEAINQERERIEKPVSINDEVVNLMNLDEFNTELMKSQKDYSEKFSKSQSRLKHVKNIIGYFRMMLQAKDAQSNISKQNMFSKITSKVSSGWNNWLYGDRGNAIYEKAFKDQTALEADLRALENQLRREPLENIDPVDTTLLNEDINILSNYDASSTSVSEFEERQMRLDVRLERITKLMPALETYLDKTIAVNKEDIRAKKSQIDGYKTDLKASAKKYKKWKSVENSHLERLFWYEFGGKVELIRKRQNQLQQTARIESQYYNTEAQKIMEDCLALERAVIEFEDKNQVNGLLTVLDRELNIMGHSGVGLLLKEKPLREELEGIRAKIKASSDLLDKELDKVLATPPAVPAGAPPVPPNLPVPPAPPGAPTQPQVQPAPPGAPPAQPQVQPAPPGAPAQPQVQPAPPGAPAQPQNANNVTDSFPLYGNFDMSKSPAPNANVLLNSEYLQMYNDIAGKFSYLFLGISPDDLNKLKLHFERLQASDLKEFRKLVLLFYTYQREIRLIFSGELGGIRVLSYGASAPTLPRVIRLTWNGNFTGLDALKEVAKKLPLLKEKLDNLNGKDEREFVKLLGGTNDVLNWIKSLK